MGQDITQEFLALRDRYIEARFAAMNPMQRKAVLAGDGPLLILAGAGSGKTTVLVSRIARLIRFGSAYGSRHISRAPTQQELDALHECVLAGKPAPQELRPLLQWNAVRPWNILAITFTNKAAQELKERINRMLGSTMGADVNASTFHSACVRILRREAERLGFPKSYTIYDADDQKRAFRELYKEREIDEKFLPMKSAMGQVSRFKDSMISPQEALAQANDSRTRKTAELYEAYQQRLKNAGAMDFDDLIYYTVRLLADNEDVRLFYRDRFQYVLVDEYQDTSVAQFQLVRLLAGDGRHICVVGDDDQSIYRFRGATIENILSFEEHFPGAQAIRLEQNYRSTGHILNAANEVIANNQARKGKNLWTDRGDGEKVQYYLADSEQGEAMYVAERIGQNLKKGMKLRDHAVLYRMNAQSGPVETYFARAGIPYRIVGGQRFYERKEVKDILSYMAIVVNPQDDLRLRRIINEPARKIGAATIERIAQLATQQGVPMLEICRHAREYAALSRAAGALEGFCRVYEQLAASADADPPDVFVSNTLDLTGYRAMLKALGEEGETRLENLGQLVSSVKTYCDQQGANATLDGFLEEVALISDIDSYDENADCVVMMTLHSAKGLEFPQVFILGMEEGVFPGERCRYSAEEMEEERRLCYVGITRAKRQLSLVASRGRMLFGRTQYNRPSRFIEEIDGEHLLADAQSDADQIESRRQGYTHTVPGGASGYSGRSMGGYTSAYLDPEYNRVGFGTGTAFRPKEPRYQVPEQQKEAPAYRAGQRVRHKTFGDGVVRRVTPAGGDCIVEVAFEQFGVKKTMAKYAPMHPIEEE